LAPAHGGQLLGPLTLTRRAEALTAAPREPYTRALMAAAFDLKAEPAR
jgi:hypothetical protein